MVKHTAYTREAPDWSAIQVRVLTGVPSKRATTMSDPGFPEYCPECGLVKVGDGRDEEGRKTRQYGCGHTATDYRAEVISALKKAGLPVVDDQSN